MLQAVLDILLGNVTRYYHNTGRGVVFKSCSSLLYSHFAGMRRVPFGEQGSELVGYSNPYFSHLGVTPYIHQHVPEIIGEDTAHPKPTGFRIDLAEIVEKNTLEFEESLRPQGNSHIGGRLIENVTLDQAGSFDGIQGRFDTLIPKTTSTTHEMYDDTGV